MIPWLSNWFFNFVWASKIGKESTIEESVGSDKFIDVGKNCYIGVNSTWASHLVQGNFGNIFYFEVKLKDNVTLAAMNPEEVGKLLQEKPELVKHEFIDDSPLILTDTPENLQKFLITAPKLNKKVFGEPEDFVRMTD